MKAYQFGVLVGMNFSTQSYVTEGALSVVLWITAMFLYGWSFKLLWKDT